MARRFLSGCSLLAAMLGCASAGGGPAPKLEDTTWQLVDVAGDRIPEGARPSSLTLQSVEHKVVGFAGCNRLIGDYRADGRSLRFTPLGSTKMACREPAMSLEKRFLDALGRAKTYALSGGMLELRDEDTILARLRAAAAP
ncbi:MAG: META domain-containing protein [Thermoanaerobaculia bacterium]